jgi:outer membrane protein assembly factor BamB
MKNSTICWLSLLLIAGSTSAAQPRILPPPYTACNGGALVQQASQYHFDACHTGFNPNETVLSPSTVPNLVLNWQYDTDGYTGSSPAVANGVVYAAGPNGIYAFYANTGGIKWNDVIVPLYSSPAVANGIVYVSNDSNVYALNAANGAQVWTYATPYLTTAQTVANGLVYFGSPFEGAVYALNASTGTLVWKVAAVIFDTPAVANGLVYFGAQDGYAYALDAQTGALAWKTATVSGGAAAPAVDNGIVYVGAGAYIFAMDARTGALLWMNGYGGGTPSVTHGMLYAAANGAAVALDALTGALRWSTRIEGQISAPPSVANGVVYIGSGNALLVALDAATGTLLWQYAMNAPNVPAVADGWLYDTANAGAGGVYAFHLPSGDK